MKYVGQINFVVLVLAVIAFAIATGLAHILANALDKIERMETEHAKRVTDLVEALQEQAREIDVLQEEKADLRDALTECQDKYKALERQTVEVETVKPATKRNSKGQFAKKVTSDEHIQPVSEVGTQENGAEA